MLILTGRGNIGEKFWNCEHKFIHMLGKM